MKAVREGYQYSGTALLDCKFHFKDYQPNTKLRLLDKNIFFVVCDKMTPEKVFV